MATNSETADSWSQSITLTLISTSQITYDDLDLDVSCTVQVSRAIASEEDDVLPIRGTYKIGEQCGGSLSTVKLKAKLFRSSTIVGTEYADQALSCNPSRSAGRSAN